LSHRIPSLNVKFDQEVYAMSDNHRRYRAILRALKQCYPGVLGGRMSQHLTVLAAFITQNRHLVTLTQSIRLLYGLWPA
jgi:hypothetical protein